MNYLDFDLEITRLAPGRYRVGVRSPAGDSDAEFSQPFSDLELENFVLKVGHMRTGKRSIGSSQMIAAQAFGHRLFETVFQGAVRESFTSSLNGLDQNTGLRIKLRLTDAPELANLPWEYLYREQQRQFVALSVETPIVRYPNLSLPSKPLIVAPPLHLAVMISNPKGNYAELNVESEKAKIANAVRGLEERGLFKVEWLETASLAELQRRLRQPDPVHIFHFIGHGGWDEAQKDGLLVFKDEYGDGHKVSAGHLATILHDYRSSLRLVVLNACEGARSSPTDPFAGVASTLVNSGLPAVLAMQFEITDGAAIQLAKEFYEALADGLPLEGAVAEARKAISASGNDLEWGTPVLYMRSADGVLFDFAQAHKAERLAAETRRAEQLAREKAERDAKRAEAEQVRQEQLAKARADVERKAKEEAELKARNEPAPMPAPTPAKPLIAASKKSPIVAALLSFFLFGGTGQIYLGQWKKGLVLVVAIVFLYFTVIGAFLAIPFGCIGVGDAYGIAKKLRQGISVGEWEFSIDWKVVGIAGMVTVIFYIGLFILSNLIGSVPAN